MKTSTSGSDPFLHFLDSNYSVDDPPFKESAILSPKKKGTNRDFPSGFSSSLFQQALKSKVVSVVLNEKRLANEIFQRLLSEEKKELSSREKELLRELAGSQAKMIILENELKEQKHKHTDLIEKNLNLGKQVQIYLGDREEFLKEKAYFEKKLKRLEHANKLTLEKYDNVKTLINFDPKKVQDQAIEKAKKATILFSGEYKIEIIPSKSEDSPGVNSKSPKASNGGTKHAGFLEKPKEKSPKKIMKKM